MIAWHGLETGCPVCSTRVAMRELSGCVAAGQDSDLLVRMEGRHVIQAEVHSCPRCRFSGYPSDFLRTLSPAQGKRFLRDVSPRLASSGTTVPTAHSTPLEQRASVETSEAPKGSPLPHLQYQWAARTAESLGISPLRQGLLWVRAYWCLRLPPAADHLSVAVRASLEKLYLKWAIARLRQGLRDATDPHPLYLVAELCRRNGNFLLAVGYFRKFLEAPGAAPYLTLAARRLLQRAQRRDSQSLRLEELLYGSSEGTNSPNADEAPRDA
ncbi:MAG TPA: DUF2225 domain-containing protein [Planctomycetota bacterium]|nr:DUF2225 domain-containing protein [Planctomycetota bacterium]